MKAIICCGLAAILFSSCHNAGKKVGEAGTEIVTSIKEGIDKNLECSLQLSPVLQAKGLKTGKFVMNEDTVSIYLIFENDFNAVITARVVDKSDKEYGRAVQRIDAKKGEAHFVDFAFGRRTIIENKSKIMLE
ncbi:MAG: hypothetical protein JSS82_20080 [Bacteroidetes bacterium]|nr:hypothetical protein [Bacteroidota bacterium]